MADGTVINAGSGGNTVATDDIGGIHYQRVKITLGANNTNDGDVASGNPMPIDNAGIDTIAGAVSGTEMQVDVVTSALPTGAATSAKQDTIIGHVDGVETLLGTIDADTSNLSTKIDTIAGAISGSEAQVDVVTSALPTGAATSAKQDTMIGHIDGLETLVTATNTKLDSLIGEEQIMTTGSLTSSGTVLTPTSGKKLRLLAVKFSLSADMTSVSFRFTSGGTDFAKFLTVKAGGLYGFSLPSGKYQTGGTDEVLHSVIDGTGTVQYNAIYTEVT